MWLDVFDPSVSLEDAIVLITDPSERKFGTGFVIYRESVASYILTCDHVVSDMGEGNIVVDGLSSELIASGADKGIDLAVLRVEGALNKPLFPLRLTGQEGQKIVTVGFQSLGKEFLIRRLEGSLGRRNRIRRSPTISIKVWDLKVVDDYDLERGYSGSPVVDPQSGYVVGVTSHRREGEKKGLAIAIEALQEIWPNSLPNLFASAKDYQENKRRQEALAIWQVECEPLIVKASQQFSEVDRFIVPNLFVYGQALTLAVIGRWYQVLREEAKAGILLTVSLQCFPQDAEECVLVTRWLEQIQESGKTSDPLRTEPSSDIALNNDMRLKMLMCFTSRGWRKIENPWGNQASD